jgi:NADPH:quinone reductase-like Zn-dependent oxidoreductase
MNNRAAFLETEKGSIVVRDGEIPDPGEGEVLIKVRPSHTDSTFYNKNKDQSEQVQACGIQPADTKVAKQAMIPLEYPTVVGSPVAGTVEALGPGVINVGVGQRVVCGTQIFVLKKARYGGLQRFTVVAASEIVEVSTQHHNVELC